MLYLQNDWRTTRAIDFEAIAEFYAKHPNAGHIRTILYKGEGTSRAASTNNLVTREPVIWGTPIPVGTEELVPGNWHYSDIPGFTRLSVAARMFDNMISGMHAEGKRMENVHLTGCDNFLLKDQPFRNIDYTGKKRTRGRKY